MKIILAIVAALAVAAETRVAVGGASPASTSDYKLLRESYLAALGSDMDRQKEILSSAAYKDGDPEAVAARYRIHFVHAFARRADYETMMSRMKAAFIRQGKDGIVKARASEDQLMRDTWQRDDYDLLPTLQALHIPTLVIAGDSDFIPYDVAQHIAQAIPNARLVTIKNCGHFSYLERPREVRAALTEFFRTPQ